jgi:hypothetical protein
MRHCSAKLGRNKADRASGTAPQSPPIDRETNCGITWNESEVSTLELTNF